MLKHSEELTSGVKVIVQSTAPNQRIKVIYGN
jgi:hypothetical protein